MPLTESERGGLRAFRRLAEDVRNAQARASAGERRLRMVDGYVDLEGWLDRTRPLCIPIRRLVLEHEAAYVGRVAGFLLREASTSPHVDQRVAVAATYDTVFQELHSISRLGGRTVTHGELFRTWLDAAVFHDNTDKRRPYEEMVREMGKAVEGIAMSLVIDVATLVLLVDDLAADLDGEPRRAAAPPPPPASPKPITRWQRLVQALRGSRS